MSRRNKSLVSFLSDRRRWIQGIVGIGIYALMSVMGISLWWILGIGAVTGIVFGKVFCRWACPIGFIMELITGLGGDKGKFQQMYQYHKLGCPIAWYA
ncbi:MAG: 4Fe-4S binding protein [Spirochaetota bacterium]